MMIQSLSNTLLESDKHPTQHHHLAKQNQRDLWHVVEDTHEKRYKPAWRTPWQPPSLPAPLFIVTSCTSQAVTHVGQFSPFFRKIIVLLIIFWQVVKNLPTKKKIPRTQLSFSTEGTGSYLQSGYGKWQKVWQKCSCRLCWENYPSSWENSSQQRTKNNER